MQAFSQAFADFIPTAWAPYPEPAGQPLAAAAWTPQRRRRLRQQFPGERLVAPAGPLKVRSNDTDHRYRPHSAFAHLSGLGTDQEPDAVLVLEPGDDDCRLYFHPRAPRTDPEFYASSRYGEMWVGPRPSLAEMTALTGLPTRDLSQLEEDLDSATPIRVLREADPAVTAAVDRIRGRAEVEADQAWAVACSELRLIKDDFEVAQLEDACAATATAFEAVVAALPQALGGSRGERWLEGVFGLHARHLGNAVGYDSIVAAGDHACTLHWIRNDGDLDRSDLLLLDAGVELDSLYTADVTRSLPLSGRFSPAQRQIYQAVWEAQAAGIAAARPGALFSDVHDAAIAVIAGHLADWGLLPVSLEEALSPDGGQFRRWMAHGTSHHLGLDVHDCAQARQENYRQGRLAPGMVITVEPGLYFKATDLLAPEPFRGVGVRIEDDILITADGNRNLSADLPSLLDQVESWMAEVWQR
ncbi:MAG: aminopeptidase P N-terminal domain-containing protein [Propionibacteriaceae bacterium]|jgi:Xaa-Pro aminopeptidase|nr:aminopeptidase P N-terminal domain-containing protein [Propionibacteriaceae bacterium]